MTHRGGRLTVRVLASRCPSRQLPPALTDKHWRRDPTPSLLWAWATTAAHPPSLATAAAPILSSSPPLGSAHWPLFSSMAPTPSSACPACQRPHHHNQPLSCMSTAFVCGGKHLRNVLWLRRPWKHRYSLCGLAYSDLVFHLKNDWLAIQLDMNEEAWWLRPSLVMLKLCLYTGLLLCYSLLFCTFIRLTSPSPSSTLCIALTAPVWHQRAWLNRLNLPLRPLITKTAHKI